MKRLLLVGMLGIRFVGQAQGLHERQIPHTQGQLHARVVGLYSFHPAPISDAERRAKSAAMDVFWNDMKAQPEVTTPLLRVELGGPNEPAFFYTDGTELLLDVSKTRNDEELAAATLPRMDLADTQPTAYFQMVHRLAADDEDVTAGALHILDRHDFRVNVPQHAMVLDQRTALMYALLTMREDRWVKPAAARLRTEQSTDGKLALLFALFYAQTDEADAALKAISNDPAQPEAVRTQAKTFLEEERNSASGWLPVMGSVSAVREERRQRLKAVSDEAMDDVQSMTEKLSALRARGKR